MKPATDALRPVACRRRSAHPGWNRPGRPRREPSPPLGRDGQPAAAPLPGPWRRSRCRGSWRTWLSLRRCAAPPRDAAAAAVRRDGRWRWPRPGRAADRATPRGRRWRTCTEAGRRRSRRAGTRPRKFRSQASCRRPCPRQRRPGGRRSPRPRRRGRDERRAPPAAGGWEWQAA